MQYIKNKSNGNIATILNIKLNEFAKGITIEYEYNGKIYSMDVSDLDEFYKKYEII